MSEWCWMVRSSTTSSATLLVTVVRLLGVSEFRFGFKDTNFSVNSFNVGYPHDMWEGGLYDFTSPTTQATVYFRLYGVAEPTTPTRDCSRPLLLTSNFRASSLRLLTPATTFVLVMPHKLLPTTLKLLHSLTGAVTRRILETRASVLLPESLS